MVEVEGSNGGEKANLLARRLQTASGDSRVTRPVRMGEIRIQGFDMSITKEEICNAIVSLKECSPSDI